MVERDPPRREQLTILDFVVHFTTFRFLLDRAYVGSGRTATSIPKTQEDRLVEELVIGALAELVHEHKGRTKLHPLDTWKKYALGKLEHAMLRGKPFRAPEETRAALARILYEQIHLPLSQPGWHPQHSGPWPEGTLLAIEISPDIAQLSEFRDFVHALGDLCRAHGGGGLQLPGPEEVHVTTASGASA